jgi:hypothetical protein
LIHSVDLDQPQARELDVNDDVHGERHDVRQLPVDLKGASTYRRKCSRNAGDAPAGSKSSHRGSANQIGLLYDQLPLRVEPCYGSREREGDKQTHQPTSPLIFIHHPLLRLIFGLVFPPLKPYLAMDKSTAQTWPYKGDSNGGYARHMY